MLLMDEPFGALDAMTRDILHDELERIWRERKLTVLFVTHNVREAARLGDRIVLLSSRPGRVIDEHRVDIPRPAPDRLPRGRGASPPRSPTGCARRWAAMATDTLPARRDRHGTISRAGRAGDSPAGQDGRAGGRRLWAATWPKLAASRSCIAVWQVVVWSRVEAAVRRCPARLTVGARAVATCSATGEFWDGRRHHAAPRPSSASPSRSPIGLAARHRGGPDPGAAGRASAR